MISNSRSVTPDAKRLVFLRQRLGWTQQEIASRAGYSVRLIRKIEKQQSVRPQTLKDVVQCYFEAIQGGAQCLTDFVLPPVPGADKAVEQEEQECELITKIREYYDVVFQKRQLDQIEGYVSPNIRFSCEGKSRVGVEAIRLRAATLLDAFDPIEFTIERIFSQGQVVVAYWVVRMKHAGEFFGIPASGKLVNVRGSSVTVFSEGLVVEGEDHFDVGNLVQQLNGQDEHVV